MRVVHRLQGSVLCSVLAVAGFASGAHAAVTLQLDFTQTGGPYTTGWTPVYANFLADTPTASVSNINGLGYGFSIDHVGVYDNGNTSESLTRSGFYTFGDNTNEHNFELTGLNPGDSVALYASAAWDGNGRGGNLVFGSTGSAGVQAQTIGDPGNAPTLANLTDIGTEVANSSGMVTGTLNGPAGPGDTNEGQIGGVEFVITPATTGTPEPTTLAGLVLGAAALVTRRR